MNDRRDKLNFLLVSFGEFFDLAFLVCQQIEPAKPSQRLIARLRTFHPANFGKVEDGVEQLALPVQSSLFRQVADLIAQSAGKWPAVIGDRPSVRFENIQDDPDRRRLSRSIRAEKTEDFAAPDIERDVVDGPDGCKVLAQIAYGKHLPVLLFS